VKILKNIATEHNLFLNPNRKNPEKMILADEILAISCARLKIGKHMRTTYHYNTESWPKV
jgi:hypothetical protein